MPLNMSPEFDIIPDFDLTPDFMTPLSRLETSFILTAFDRSKEGSPGECGGDLCSDHTNEYFLYKYHSIMALNSAKFSWYVNEGLLKSLNHHLMNLSEHQYYDDLRSKFLKEIKSRSTTELLLWCQRLLIQYHTKEECSEYLALSLKFIIYAHYYCRYALCTPSENAMDTMLGYMKLISKYKCGHTLFRATLNFFLWFHRKFFTGNAPLQDVLLPVLPEVLDIAHQLQFNFFEDWTSEDLLAIDNYSTWSSLISIRRFLVLAKYGYEDVFNYYIHHDCGDLLNEIDWDDMFGFQSVPFEEVTGRNYRLVQLVLFFMKRIYDEIEDRDGYYEALRVLWESIPDPYFTRDMFFSCFPQSKDFIEFHFTWCWYENVVWLERESIYEPRTLQHLSRCVIRRALTKSFQLPHGVERLGVPLTIQNYITLEYCKEID